MKKLLYVATLVILLASCGGSGNSKDSSATAAQPDQKATAQGNPSYDANRGEGKFTKVDVSTTLDVPKSTAGEKVYAVKCSSCHKLTEEKLVGPGWKGVTSRHAVEWIMNFATNPDAMLDKDPKAQAMLEICLVRMPNQNLSDDDARNVYEFMRKNDGVK